MRSASKSSALLRFVLLLALGSVASSSLVACESERAGDPDADAGPPTALGSGSRIRDLMNPANKARPASGSQVTITGATFLTVDTFDETHNGKSKGTVYMQDVPPTPLAPPYSGVALYSPVYLPANLEPAPGDVLDLTGTFSVSTSIGAASFANGTALTQIDDPVVKPRFEYELPTPLVINASDLDNYATGQQWVSMLVTIQNITFVDNLSDDGSGRDVVHITSDTSSNGPTLDNELFDVATWNKEQTTPPLEKGQTLKSVTGIVTWFYNYHIAPRSPADIVVQ